MPITLAPTRPCDTPEKRIQSVIHNIEVLWCRLFRSFGTKDNDIIERPEYHPQFPRILAGFLQSDRWFVVIVAHFALFATRLSPSFILGRFSVPPTQSPILAGRPSIQNLVPSGE
jgi:hypothetical protein